MAKVIRIGELPAARIIDNQDLLVINNFVEDRTYAITWLDLIGNIKEINQPVIFSRGTAAKPSLAFIDYNAGFFSPGPGQLAVTTNATPRMIFDGQGNIEIGTTCDIGGVTFNSKALFKCETTFREDLDIFGDVEITGDLNINGELVFNGDIGVEINGNLFAYGDVTFGDPSNGCAGFFEIYSKSTYYCDAFFEQNLQVDKDVTIGNTLSSSNLIVSGDTSLQGDVTLTGNVIVNDNITIDIQQGDIDISGDLNVGGVITGDGSGITNLNIPGSLAFQGSIDLTQPAPSGVSTGDLYITDNPGVVHFSFNGIAGDTYEANQFVFYTVNGTWDLGSVQNEEGFVTLSGTQTITGEKTFTSVLNAFGGINATGQSIFARDLTLTGKGVSALTLASDSDVTLTTKSYVDDRSVNAIGDFPLTFGNYISGVPSDQYDGSIAITANIEATVTNTPNKVVARDENGDFAARNITADLLGRADVSAKLDILIDEDSDITSFLLFVDPSSPVDGEVSESQLVYADSGLYYNPSTNVLTTNRVVADITGNVTGNADTATRLETPRTLWGQTFDGTADVTGDMVEVGNITSIQTDTYDIGSSANVWANIYATTFHGYLDGNAFVAERTKEKLTAGLHVLSTNNVTEFDGSQATTWYIDETPENVSLKIVSRDSDGSFRSNIITANEFVGPLTGDVTGNVSGSSGSSTGNAATATALETPRTLWGQTFDGTADVNGQIQDTGDVFPSVTSAYNIGSPSLKYANVYVDQIFAEIDGNSGTSDRVNNPLTRGAYISGGPLSFDGSVAGTWVIDATPLNNPNFIVARDGNGDFAAGTITSDFVGNLTGDVTGNVSGSSGSSTGNAATATALETPRTLWGQTFDGTGNVDGDITDTGNIIPSTTLVSTVGSPSRQYSDIYATTFHGNLDGIADSADKTNHSLFRGVYVTGTLPSFNGSANDTWDIDATPDNVPDKIVARDASGNFSAGLITATRMIGNLTGDVTGNVSGSSGSSTGNAATASKLQTPRDIEVKISGATLGSGSTAFDGSSDIQIVVPTYGIVDLESLTALPA